MYIAENIAENIAVAVDTQIDNLSWYIRSYTSYRIVIENKS